MSGVGVWGELVAHVEKLGIQIFIVFVSNLYKSSHNIIWNIVVKVHKKKFNMNLGYNFIKWKIKQFLCIPWVLIACWSLLYF
jgi:hypothetical protein